MNALSSRVLATTRPYADGVRWVRIAPGALLGVIVLGLLWFRVTPERRWMLLIAIGLTVAIHLAMLLPWERWPDRWQPLLPLMGFLPVAALDYAAGLFYLGAIPVIWLGLFSTRRVMVIALAGFLITAFVPRLAVPDAYPAPSMLTLLVASVIVVVGGLALQSLLSSAREAIAHAQAAKEEAKADRDILNAYLDHLGALVAVLDPDGRILLFNRLMEEVTGARTTDMIGRGAGVLATEGDAGREAFARVLAGEGRVTTESDLRTADGQTRRIVWRGTGLTDSDGRVTRVIVVGIDVTAERQAKAATQDALAREQQAAAQLRELNAVRNDFVATVTHDLRTPLTSIIGSAELLLAGEAGALAPMQQRLATAIDRNARRLDTLVGDLLLLSRVESGAMRLNLTTVAVSDIIDGALESVQATWSPDVSLRVNAPQEPVLVRGDAHQLERVITNLLSNALKFTPPGGEVNVSVDAEPTEVRMRIADSGIGIPDEELPYVFDRFYRSSRSLRKGKPGTGLGLAIAKSIVDLHEGAIEASAKPGGGTVFTITLPRAAYASDPDRQRVS